jgi:GT2 family glycosyltransferase
MIVGWVGMGGHSWMAEQVREDLILTGITLKTCHEYANADVAWSLDGFIPFIDSCDVMILPARTRIEPAKSANRLALAWSRGKACVVAPLPAYMKYVLPGENALVASSPQAFIDAIKQLRDQPELRQKLGQQGKEMASRFLHPRDQAPRFFAKVPKTKLPAPWDKNTVLQIIIPHYAPTLEFLEPCLRSLAKADLPLTDVLVVSSSSLNPAEAVEKFNGQSEGIAFRCIHVAERKSFSEANNIGIKNADPKSTHFLLLNDDTIVPRDALRGYFEALGNRDDTVLNPYSNCDQGWLHNDPMRVQRGRIELNLHPGMQLAQVMPYFDELRDFRPSFDRALVPSPFCAMYATLIPRRVMSDTGLLNTQFLSGGEDADWCYRAQKLGFKTCWTRNAFVFHFGGKTRKVSEDEDKDRHLREDQHNNSLLHLKFPQKAKTKKLVIWTGPAWENWDLDSYKTTGIGGSETWAGQLAETAAANGWQVTMVGQHEPKWRDFIQLVPWQSWDPEQEVADVLLCSRNLNPIDWRTKAKKIYVVAHDIWLLSGKEISDYHYRKVDKFITLSPWHHSFFIQHHQVPEQYRHKIIVVPNGVNTELFQ